VGLTEAQALELAVRLLGENEFRVRAFGAGRFSDVFLLTEVRSQQEFVLRVGPPDDMLQLFYEKRMMLQEPAIHQRLLAETKVPVPPILTYDFSREVIDRDFLVMPRSPGTPLSQARISPEANRRAFREWGRWVSEIHGLTDSQGRFGYLGEHACMQPQPSWREAFAVMYRKLLDDVVACGVYDESTADRAMRLLEDHLQVFDHCRTSHLCHGDLWATNVLVTPDGSVTGVLDFERACWGDPEWDLAIAEYCGMTRAGFWEGYGRRLESFRGDAALRRFFYILYEHQKYIVISISARRNDPRGARRYATESLSAMVKYQRSGVPVL